MRRGMRVLVLPAVLGLLTGGCALEPNEGPQAPEQSRPARGRDARQPLVPPQPGPHLAFDVTRRDYQRTRRYVLEISDASGRTAVHDVKKPPLVNRRTIMVPLPDLAPGAYTLVIIAENESGATRSAAITHQVGSR